MNRPFKVAPAGVPTVPAQGTPATPITCAPLANTKRAVAGSVSVPTDPATPFPDCTECGRGYWVCICDMPEPEQEHFRPAINRDPDWYRGCKAVVALGAVWATYLTVTLP